MTHNIGKTDRIVRIIAGALIIGTGFLVPGNVGVALMAIGVVPLMTGMLGNCPLYGICKINTLHT